MDVTRQVTKNYRNLGSHISGSIEEILLMWLQSISWKILFLSPVDTWSFDLESSLREVLSESGSYLSTSCSFSLVSSTYSKFTLVIISFTWMYVACVCCCDWDKLRLLVFLWKILLIMLLWYPFSFRTWFIPAFSFLKSSFFVIMEYAQLNKEETTLSCNLFDGGSCSVGFGQYASAPYIPIRRSFH